MKDKVSEQEQIRAIRWKLGIAEHPTDDRSCWDRVAGESVFRGSRNRVAEIISKAFETVLKCKMGSLPPEKNPVETAQLRLVEHFLASVSQEGEIQKAFIKVLNAAVINQWDERKIVRERVAEVWPGKAIGHWQKPRESAGNPRIAVPGDRATTKDSITKVAMTKDNETTQRASHSSTESSLPRTQPMTADGEPALSPQQAQDDPVSEAQPDLPPGAALWKYLEVSDALDRHDDCWKDSLVAGTGLSLAGARVRGRKHKHEGTNCDDWFEVQVQGPWSIIAVSDGAGSSPFSRVGAEVATRAAVKSLQAGLEGVAPPQLPAPGFRRGPAAGGSGAEELRKCLHIAIHAAHEAVIEAFESRKERTEYQALLNRELTLEDLSGTLRLAVHCVVPFEDRAHDLVVACGVGDGMTAVIDTEHKLHLLGSEEGGGKYSGETEFLTRTRNLHPDKLDAGTYVCWLPLRTLMVMSDGVADPYFPNNPGMLYLYGDLLINGLIPLGNSETGKVPDGIAKAIREGRYRYSIERLLPDAAPERFQILSSASLAQQSGRQIEEIIGNTAAMRAAAQGTTSFNHDGIADRLLAWLDSFYVRGEFDDRTLVVLHRETVS